MGSPITPRIAGSRMRPWQNAGAPSSGTSGTLVNEAEAGALLWDTTNGVLFMNEGTRTSPYWTPVGIDQFPLFGVYEDFKDQVGKPLANTDAETILASGLRVFGDGVAENDSGLAVQTAGEGGCVAHLTTTNEDAHVAAIGMEAGVMQPDQHQLLVVDVEMAQITAITDRACFVGFVGTAIDAFVEPVTGATTTATLVQDDLAGMFFDTGLTDGDRWYGVHNKSDAAATQDLTADGDTSTDQAAAGTYQRFRCEIAADGDLTCFVDKAQVYSQAIALDVDEECSPVVYLAAAAAAVKVAAIRRVLMYAYR